MKTFKMIANGAKMVLAATTMTVAMTSCLNDGDTSYAYISGVSTDCYANSNNAFVLYQSSSAWELKKGSDASWFLFAKNSGAGPVADITFLNTELNTTNKYRTATINLTNTEGKSSSAQVYQWGTRGDGSLGNARDVRKITGSDGSEISLYYDHLHRVASLSVKDANNIKNDYFFTYPIASDSARIMSVHINGEKTATAKAQVNFGWQPTGDLATDDKSEVVTWSAVGSSQVTVKRNESGANRNVQTVSLSGFENPDSELSHSKLIYSYQKDGKYPEMNLAINHDGKKSNRKQSVDVNQLIFGVDNINPYLLVGFYRYARCSYIYESAEDTTNNIRFTVTTTLNSDESVNTLSVGREDGSVITYTFEY